MDPYQSLTPASQFPSVASTTSAGAKKKNKSTVNANESCTTNNNNNKTGGSATHNININGSKAVVGGVGSPSSPRGMGMGGGGVEEVRVDVGHVARMLNLPVYEITSKLQTLSNNNNNNNSTAITNNSNSISASNAAAVVTPLMLPTNATVNNSNGNTNNASSSPSSSPRQYHHTRGGGGEGVAVANVLEEEDVVRPFRATTAAAVAMHIATGGQHYRMAGAGGGGVNNTDLPSSAAHRHSGGVGGGGFSSLPRSLLSPRGLLSPGRGGGKSRSASDYASTSENDSGLGGRHSSHFYDNSSPLPPPFLSMGANTNITIHADDHNAAHAAAVLLSGGGQHHQLVASSLVGSSVAAAASVTPHPFGGGRRRSNADDGALPNANAVGGSGISGNKSHRQNPNAIAASATAAAPLSFSQSVSRNLGAGLLFGSSRTVGGNNNNGNNASNSINNTPTLGYSAAAAAVVGGGSFRHRNSNGSNAVSPMLSPYGCQAPTAPSPSAAISSSPRRRRDGDGGAGDITESFASEVESVAPLTTAERLRKTLVAALGPVQQKHFKLRCVADNADGAEGNGMMVSSVGAAGGGVTSPLHPARLYTAASRNASALSRHGSMRGVGGGGGTVAVSPLLLMGSTRSVTNHISPRGGGGQRSQFASQRDTAGSDTMRGIAVAVPLGWNEPLEGLRRQHDTNTSNVKNNTASTRSTAANNNMADSLPPSAGRGRGGSSSLTTSGRYNVNDPSSAYYNPYYNLNVDGDGDGGFAPAPAEGVGAVNRATIDGGGGGGGSFNTVPSSTRNRFDSVNGGDNTYDDADGDYDEDDEEFYSDDDENEEDEAEEHDEEDFLLSEGEDDDGSTNTNAYDGGGDMGIGFDIPYASPSETLALNRDLRKNTRGTTAIVAIPSPRRGGDEGGNVGGGANAATGGGFSSVVASLLPASFSKRGGGGLRAEKEGRPIDHRLLSPSSSRAADTNTNHNTHGNQRSPTMTPFGSSRPLPSSQRSQQQYHERSTFLSIVRDVDGCGVVVGVKRVGLAVAGGQASGDLAPATPPTVNTSNNNNNNDDEYDEPPSIIVRANGAAAALSSSGGEEEDEAAPLLLPSSSSPLPPPHMQRGNTNTNTRNDNNNSGFLPIKGLYDQPYNNNTGDVEGSAEGGEDHHNHHHNHLVAAPRIYIDDTNRPSHLQRLQERRRREQQQQRVSHANANTANAADTFGNINSNDGGAADGSGDASSSLLPPPPRRGVHFPEEVLVKSVNVVQTSTNTVVMHIEYNRPRVAYAGALLAVALQAVGWVLCISASYSPDRSTTIATGRAVVLNFMFAFFGGFLMYLALACVQGSPNTLEKLSLRHPHHLRKLAVCVLSGAGSLVALAGSLCWSTSAANLILCSLFPLLLSMFLATAIDKKLSIFDGIGLLLTMVGAAVVIAGELQRPSTAAEEATMGGATGCRYISGGLAILSAILQTVRFYYQGQCRRYFKHLSVLVPTALLAALGCLGLAFASHAFTRSLGSDDATILYISTETAKRMAIASILLFISIWLTQATAQYFDNVTVTGILSISGVVAALLYGAFDLPVMGAGFRGAACALVMMGSMILVASGYLNRRFVELVIDLPFSNRNNSNTPQKKLYRKPQVRRSAASKARKQREREAQLAASSYLYGAMLANKRRKEEEEEEADEAKREEGEGEGADTPTAGVDSRRRRVRNNSGSSSGGSSGQAGGGSGGGESGSSPVTASERARRRRNKTTPTNASPSSSTNTNAGTSGVAAGPKAAVAQYDDFVSRLQQRREENARLRERERLERVAAAATAMTTPAAPHSPSDSTVAATAAAAIAVTAPTTTTDRTPTPPSSATTSAFGSRRAHEDETVPFFEKK